MSKEDAKNAALEATWSFHTIKENLPFNSAACTSKLLRGPFGFTKFSLGKTKCAAIVNNVLAPMSDEMIKNELESARFVSIATDASNHGSTKMFPAMVRYFHRDKGVQVCKMLLVLSVIIE